MQQVDIFLITSSHAPKLKKSLVSVYPGVSGKNIGEEE